MCMRAVDDWPSPSRPRRAPPRRAREVTTRVQGPFQTEKESAFSHVFPNRALELTTAFILPSGVRTRPTHPQPWPPTRRGVTAVQNDVAIHVFFLLLFPVFTELKATKEAEMPAHAGFFGPDSPCCNVMRGDRSAQMDAGAGTTSALPWTARARLRLDQSKKQCPLGRARTTLPRSLATLPISRSNTSVIWPLAPAGGVPSRGGRCCPRPRSRITCRRTRFFRSFPFRFTHSPVNWVHTAFPWLVLLHVSFTHAQHTKAPPFPSMEIRPPLIFMPPGLRLVLTAQHNQTKKSNARSGFLPTQIPVTCRFACKRKGDRVKNRLGRRYTRACGSKARIQRDKLTDRFVATEG